jgi:UDPglucose--hexose-1-phosphate uridylyltransferase
MTPSGIVKRTTVLADGRELIYFDDADTTLPAERTADARHLDPRTPTATMRQDVLTGEWISIAAARQNRVFLPPADKDPLAPTTADNPSEVPSNYDVAVFENRSPSFGPALGGPAPVGGELSVGGMNGTPTAVGAPPSLEALSEIGLNRSYTSVGRCEVVCFSPQHEGSFGAISPSRARTVIEAWADRTAVLSALPGVQQVFPFENRGEEIGVTLQHPHGQIYSYPYITPRTTRLLESVEKVGPDLFERVLESERASSRVVLAGHHWTAYVPFAARWPIEVHMLPHRHVPDFAATSDDERDELAGLYLTLLRGIDKLYDTPTPYIAAWHQAPVNVGRDDIRLMLQVTSPRRAANKLKYLAGSEAAMGAFIGDVMPENTAEFIREGISRV